MERRLIVPAAARGDGEADSATLSGTLVTVNVPVQSAGQVYHIVLDCRLPEL